MLTPPRLKNDCFALPPGVDWTPVDEALTRLQGALSVVVATETLPADQAEGRILAEAAMAKVDNSTNMPASPYITSRVSVASSRGEGPVGHFLILHPVSGAARL